MATSFYATNTVAVSTNAIWRNWVSSSTTIATSMHTMAEMWTTVARQPLWEQWVSERGCTTQEWTYRIVTDEAIQRHHDYMVPIMAGKPEPTRAELLARLRKGKYTGQVVLDPSKPKRVLRAELRQRERASEARAAAIRAVRERRAEELARAAAQRAEYAAREAERRAADEARWEAQRVEELRARARAAETLLELLDDEQRASMTEHRRITVKGSEGGTYRIRTDTVYNNVRQLDDDGNAIRVFCTHLTHGEPMEDSIVAQILAIEADEPSLARRANVQEYYEENRPLRVPMARAGLDGMLGPQMAMAG